MRGWIFSLGMSSSLPTRPGVGEPDASLAAVAGIVIFRIACALWVGGSEQRDFSGIVDESLARLRAIVAV